MKYYLGIDGGGTRTTAAVSDENGNIILKEVGKTINFYSVGMETARANLAAIIEGIEERIGKIYYSGAFIGCSALDDEADNELTEKLCAGVINAEKIKIHSDVYIALKAVGEAVCPCAAICGTGSMAIAEDENGNTQITGGWGHTIGDEGSALGISLRALRLCCQLCDRGEAHPLLERANAFFGVSDFRKAIDKIYSPETTKDVLAGFAADVGRLASNGDETALNIIATEAENFAETVLILLDRVKKCSVLGLYGGVFQHNESFVKSFSEKIKAYYPDIIIKLLDIPPEESALELARKL